MNHLIIRAYDKDDYLARLCYESWILSGFEGKVYFYCQLFSAPHYQTAYSPNLIKDKGEIIFHENHCNNYGGPIGAVAMIEMFNKLEYEDEDIIISCDTDIVIKENPINYIEDDIDFAGHGGLIMNELYHVSGQLQMIRGRMVRGISKDDSMEINKRSARLGDFRLQVCDDTYMSIRVNDLKGKVKLLSDLWHHVKSYNYAPRQDWDKIIEHYKSY